MLVVECVVVEGVVDMKEEEGGVCLEVSGGVEPGEGDPEVEELECQHEEEGGVLLLVMVTVQQVGLSLFVDIGSHERSQELDRDHD